MTASPQDFRNKVVLAPMMKGGNRTFRRLAHRFGADIVGGEMALSGKVAKCDRRELALISARREEGVFSAQICGCNATIMSEAAKVIADRGASIIDINAGCPMDAVIRYGGGSALLESPTRLARIVEAMKKAVSLPVTVKIRTGFYDDKPRVVQIAKALESAGADALSVHARSRQQFYESPADWQWIRQAVESVKIPVIGNGDIRTYEDALRMMAETGCDSVMIGRAALQRPWIFSEIKEKRPINLSPRERWEFIEEHRNMIEEAFGQKLGFEILRFHAGWYIRWHPDQKEIRTRWDGFQDAADTQTLLEELRALILEGPEILPMPNLAYAKVEAG